MGDATDTTVTQIPVLIELGGGATCDSDLLMPRDPVGVVLFAHGSGSSRHSVRNRGVARRLVDHGVAALLLDLLTVDEERSRAEVFDVDKLAGRLVAATRQLRRRGDCAEIPVGYFGASTGAAAALVAAADDPAAVTAVVSRGGRPDLADGRLADVTSPTLLIVGGADKTVLQLNRVAFEALRCEKALTVVPGATHLFEEPGTLDAVASLAADWFVRHFAPPQ